MCRTPCLKLKRLTCLSLPHAGTKDHALQSCLSLKMVAKQGRLLSHLHVLILNCDTQNQRAVSVAGTVLRTAFPPLPVTQWSPAECIDTPETPTMCLLEMWQEDQMQPKENYQALLVSQAIQYGYPLIQRKISILEEGEYMKSIHSGSPPPCWFTMIWSCCPHQLSWWEWELQDEQSVRTVSNCGHSFPYVGYLFFWGIPSSNSRTTQTKSPKFHITLFSMCFKDTLLF